MSTANALIQISATYDCIIVQLKLHMTKMVYLRQQRGKRHHFHRHAPKAGGVDHQWQCQSLGIAARLQQLLVKGCFAAVDDVHDHGGWVVLINLLQQLGLQVPGPGPGAICMQRSVIDRHDYHIIGGGCAESVDIKIVKTVIQMHKPLLPDGDSHQNQAANKQTDRLGSKPFLRMDGRRQSLLQNEGSERARLDQQDR